MLNGEAVEIAGVGFAGICGFGGGFGWRMLNAWGEPLIKQFVQESISHTIRLEQALVQLPTEHRIGVLHYSPIRTTLEGEDPEIYAFLGSSRLEEPSIDSAPRRYSMVTRTMGCSKVKRPRAFRLQYGSSPWQNRKAVSNNRSRGVCVRRPTASPVTER
jgi:hypothetical protein